MRGRNANGELLLGRDWQDGNPAVTDDKFIRRNLNQKYTLSQAFVISLMEGMKLRTSGNWFINQSTYEGFTRDYLASPGNIVRTRSSSASYDKGFNQTYNAVLSYDTSIATNHNISAMRSEEHTSELQSCENLVFRLLRDKK